MSYKRWNGKSRKKRRRRAHTHLESYCLDLEPWVFAACVAIPFSATWGWNRHCFRSSMNIELPNFYFYVKLKLLFLALKAFIFLCSLYLRPYILTSPHVFIHSTFRSNEINYKLVWWLPVLPSPQSSSHLSLSTAVRQSHSRSPKA
jgi:hypothetical protein